MLSKRPFPRVGIIELALIYTSLELNFTIRSTYFFIHLEKAIDLEIFFYP